MSFNYNEISLDYDLEFQNYNNHNLYWGSAILAGLELLSKLDLSRVDYKVILLLAAYSKDSDNTVRISQKEIADKVIIDKSNISRSITKLRNFGLIVKIPSGFMINPNLLYKGSTRNEHSNKINSLMSNYKKLLNKEINEGKIDENKLLSFEYDHH